MSELQRVEIMIEPATQTFPGRVSFGYFRIKGDKIVMCGENGRPIVDRLGNRYERSLGPSQNPQTIAALLTHQIRRKVRGDELGSFNRPLPPPEKVV